APGAITKPTPFNSDSRPPITLTYIGAKACARLCHPTGLSALYKHKASSCANNVQHSWSTQSLLAKAGAWKILDDVLRSSHHLCTLTATLNVSGGVAHNRLIPILTDREEGHG